MRDEPNVAQVFSAITALAHALDLSVVAEGIETADALDTVRALGCEGGQGYHLGRPVPADRLVDLLRAYDAPTARLAEAERPRPPLRRG